MRRTVTPTVTMRATSVHDFRASNCAGNKEDCEKETLQVLIDNLKAVIQSHSIPATAIHHFTVPVLHNIIDTFNRIDAEYVGALTPYSFCFYSPPRSYYKYFLDSPPHAPPLPPLSLPSHPTPKNTARTASSRTLKFS